MSTSKKILVMAALLVPLGCSDDARDDTSAPERPFGTLELRWSIDGATAPAACEALGATAFEVIVFDEGYFVTEREVPCSEFEARVDLFVDDYVARTTLVDADDFPVTRRIIEDFFLIADAAVTRLAMDFPGDRGAGPLPVPDAGAAPPATGGADASAGLGDAGAR